MSFDELREEGNGERPGIDTFFPERFVNELSRREVFNKHLFRPNTYLHKWWARRCGTTFRAILKQFVADPARRDYYAPGGLEGKVVLDPMMGGGTTLHEAIRLGANVIGADIDPIPIVQARATLLLASLTELQRAFERFFADLYRAIGHYFQTECPTCGRTVDATYTLHGLIRACACGEVVQVERYVLRQEKDRTIRIQPDTWEIYDGAKPPAPTRTSHRAERRLITKKEQSCPTCGETYRDLLDIPYYARYTPIAIVGVCPDHGMFFRSPGEADRGRMAQADNLRNSLDIETSGDLNVQGGPKSNDLLRRNIRSYADLFSSRQTLYLHHAIRLLNAPGEYGEASRLNLGLLVSTSLEFNSLLCGYKGWSRRRPGAIRHVFALHAYSFPYTALENNSVNPRRASGNLQQLFHDRIERGRTWAMEPVERRIGPDGKSHPVRMRGEIDCGVQVHDQESLRSKQRAFWLIHGDSRQLPLDDHSVDMVVTDPPYYDSVQYSDLAAFFRVWLARLLPDEADWTYSPVNSAVAAHRGDDGFIRTISGIFAECQRVLKREAGRLVFTFHHWHPNAWAELTIALKRAGFKLINAYVVFSEHPISVHIRNLNSLKHDSILVLAADAQGTEWPPVETIEQDDSATFCRRCSATLGWLLAANFSEDEIKSIWHNLIQRFDRQGTRTDSR